MSFRCLIMIPLLVTAAPAMAQSTAGALLDRMMVADTNGDRVISRAELIASRAANFARLDRNGDGALTDDDIPGILRGSAIAKQLVALRAEFDANQNGKVSRDEFVNGPTPVFDRADTDRDGRLTRAEIDAARALAQR